MYPSTTDEMASHAADALVTAKVAADYRALKTVITDTLTKYWADKIAIVWITSDVHATANRLEHAVTEAEARTVLKDVLDGHDAEYGVSWRHLENAVEDHGRELTQEEMARVNGGETIVDVEPEGPMPEKPCADGSIALDRRES